MPERFRHCPKLRSVRSAPCHCPTMRSGMYAPLATIITPFFLSTLSTGVAYQGHAVKFLARFRSGAACWLQVVVSGVLMSVCKCKCNSTGSRSTCPWCVGGLLPRRSSWLRQKRAGVPHWGTAATREHRRWSYRKLGSRRGGVRVAEGMPYTLAGGSASRRAGESTCQRDAADGPLHHSM